ncbi:MAG: hypothetical protein SFU98_00565, partial [Leptospiraceae bacterium]|nr:hypothetical protein [Leptospiraceae bacterium]
MKIFKTSSILLGFLLMFTCFESIFAQTGTCQILGRRQIDQTLSATTLCTSTIQVSSVSQYLVAKMVGVNSINANLYLEKQSGSTYTVVASRTTSGTSTENMDLVGLSVGYYRVCAQRGASSGSGMIHVTFDVVAPQCGTGRDTCFGGVGKNCDGGVNGFCNGTTSDGLKQCQVAIGSQMH